jgi:hypothetical protein
VEEPSASRLGSARPGRHEIPGPVGDGVLPVQGPVWPLRKKDAHSEHAKLRSPGEQAITQLRNWDVLRRLRCCLRRSGPVRFGSVRFGEIIRTVLVLQLRQQDGKGSVETDPAVWMNGFRDLFS